MCKRSGKSSRPDVKFTAACALESSVAEIDTVHFRLVTMAGFACFRLAVATIAVLNQMTSRPLGEIANY